MQTYNASKFGLGPQHGVESEGPMMPEMPGQGGGFRKFLKRFLEGFAGIEQQEDPSQVQYEQQLKDYYAQQREGRQFENQKNLYSHQAGLKTPEDPIAKEKAAAQEVHAMLAKRGWKYDTPGYDAEFQKRYAGYTGKGIGPTMRGAQDEAHGFPGGAFAGPPSDEPEVAGLSPGGINHDMDPGENRNWFKKLLGIGSQYQGGL